VTLHICYGNRYGKPSFEGSYSYPFPTILEAKVHALSLGSRRGEEDIQLFKEFRRFTSAGRDRRQDPGHQSSALVADRIRRALEVVLAERRVAPTECVHLPATSPSRN
jgi:5-methyltetrahydropteroyltriglutamate--homocysteine methyltransferase